MLCEAFSHNLGVFFPHQLECLFKEKLVDPRYGLTQALYVN